MPDYQHAEQTDLSAIEDHERFLLRSAGEIRNELLNLSKKPDIITAYFNGGKEFILTAVLGVLADRQLLVLDVGPDDAITQRAIAAGNLVCTTRSLGVPVKFRCQGLRSAKFQGQAAIAAAMPDNLYRQQRREYFRVSVPRIQSPNLDIHLSDGQLRSLKVLDLSIGGLSISDPEDQFHPAIHDEFQGCRLSLPEFGELTVNIQIRNQSKFHRSNEVLSRYGAAFVGLGMSDNLHLQRYLYHLQALNSATS
jgi:c-di-GMP-binding flagellar brake protein YcgR